MQAMMEDAEAQHVVIQETASAAKAEAAELLEEKAKAEAERAERDERSVFVGNVHWEATGEEVAA
jgi:hypothetical protein